MDLNAVLDFIRSSPSPLTKRDIARAFGIKGGENRVALKQILKKLEKDGAITKQAGGAFAVPDGLPAVAVVEVIDIDIDGDVFARPVEWDESTQSKPPRIEMKPEKKGHPALIQKDRVLASLTRISGDVYEGRTIRKLDSDKGRVLGILRSTKNGYILQPTDKKAKYDFPIKPGDEGDAHDGDLAVGEIQPARGLKQKQVRIVDILGREGDPKTISLISLHENGLREDFPKPVLQACKGLKVPDLDKRQDLRSTPLVTIDGADARDFDDAIFAEPCDLPNGEEGYHLIVAIADVSFYVRPESDLDLEAQRRGNSTYFPDRVVPMLPEPLSNDLCSLRPDEDRACLAAHLWIDKNGSLIKYKFVRALMRSYARLIYEQVQMAQDNANYETADGKDLSTILPPLYEVFGVLDKARKKRGALDLDLPERQILIDENGVMSGVKQRVRLDAHKMIEEFMILANVAAAKALEDKKAPCVYRVHDKPGMDKLDSAREFIESFGLSLPKGENIQPAKLNHILAKAAEMPFSHLISQVILRSQSQAVYSTENIGHFGLALQKYAHFTSPIRRYADLLVHRSLVAAHGLPGGGGLSDGEQARLDEIAGHISTTERNSMSAERSAVDRFTAAYLVDKIGAEFTGQISGVTRFGLFVTLDESGADGLVPMKSMSDDFYIHDEDAHALIGRRRKKIYRLGAPVTVRLKEADGITGSTVLELTGESKNGADIPGMNFPKSKKGSQHKAYDKNPPKRGGKKSHNKNFKSKKKK
ncbi:MAG: ribonuclease R [Alphaproteobacteria bacterium]